VIQDCHASESKTNLRRWTGYWKLGGVGTQLKSTIKTHSLHVVPALLTAQQYSHTQTHTTHKPHTATMYTRMYVKLNGSHTHTHTHTARVWMRMRCANKPFLSLSSKQEEVVKNHQLGWVVFRLCVVCVCCVCEGECGVVVRVDKCMVCECGWVWMQRWSVFLCVCECLHVLHRHGHKQRTNTHKHNTQTRTEWFVFVAKSSSNIF